MSTRATGAFDIRSWDETAYDEREGATLLRAHVTKTFYGDVEGESTTDILMSRSQGDGSAAYVGFERVVGSVHGRWGSFILQHVASATRGEQSAAWSVLPGSATGELSGLRGEATIINRPDGGHSFVLDYDFE